MSEISLRAATLAGGFKADSGALPARIQVLKWGVNETSEGPVIVDAQTARVFAANQKAIGRERVALDFEHNTVPGTEEYKRSQEPRPIAGYCNLVCVPGEGIFGEALTYTATGEKSARDFADLSLAPYLDRDGRVIAAHSVALTRTGAAYGITFSSLSSLSSIESLSADLRILSASSGAVATNPQTKPMPEKFLSLAAIATLVGLSAEADEAAVTAKLKDRLAPAAPVDLTPLTTKLDALEKKIVPVDLAPLTTRLDKLEERLNTEASAATTAEKSRLVALFAKDGKAPIDPSTGKAYTAEELAKLDLPILRILHANTAVTVPLAARSRAATDTPAIDPNLKGRARFIAAQERDNSRLTGARS